MARTRGCRAGLRSARACEHACTCARGRRGHTASIYAWYRRRRGLGSGSARKANRLHRPTGRLTVMPAGSRPQRPSPPAPWKLHHAQARLHCCSTPSLRPLCPPLSPSPPPGAPGRAALSGSARTRTKSTHERGAATHHVQMCCHPLQLLQRSCLFFRSRRLRPALAPGELRLRWGRRRCVAAQQRRLQRPTRARTQRESRGGCRRAGGNEKGARRAPVSRQCAGVSLAEGHSAPKGLAPLRAPPRASPRRGGAVGRRRAPPG